MQVYNNLEKINAEQTCVALGYFDGVHIGHQSVIKKAVQAAASAKSGNASAAVFTFFQSESDNVKGERIFSKDEKFKRIFALGVSHCLCPAFSSFAHFTKQQFVEEVLFNCLSAKQVFCGENFTFGKNKSGNVEDLKQLCKQWDIEVHVKKLFLYKGDAVSSTRIKNLLSNGDMELVNKLLGKPYALCEKVISGKKLGREMGFPTINQKFAQNFFTPKHGVYLTRVLLDGKIYAGATSIGQNPTVNGEDITCETHIINFSGDLYGKTVRVEFLKYYKPSVKFENLTELRNYICEAAHASANLQTK